MKIYSIFVEDPVFGDELAESYTDRNTAKNRAGKLRKIFREVAVRPTMLHVGYNAPVELKRANNERTRV